MNYQFSPTALLVMSHNVTGLKYFCKTADLRNVYNYKGSGLYWKKHLNKHGKDVTVGVMGFYTDYQRCRDAALKFSQENDIVNSDAWANLVLENGTDGALNGSDNPFYGKSHTPEMTEHLRQQKIGKSVNKGAYRSPENRAKISASLKGRKNPAVSKALTGRKLSEETKQKLSESRKGYTHSMETREKLRQKAIVQWAKQKAENE
jgi:hypothetical protein